MKFKFFTSVFLFLLLYASCSSDDDATPDTGGEAEATLVIREDVEFELESSSNSDPATAYSTVSGIIYNNSAVTVDNVATIDIVSITNQAFIAFDSTNTGTTGATTTKYQYSNIALTVEEFDAMTDDVKLKDLTVTDENDSVSSSYRGVILFENAAGKKGAIKIDAINASRLLVDIKIQK